MDHHDHVRALPKLLPGPRSSTPQPSTAVMRPKKNSTACLACKQAKRKCSGPPEPCKACASNNQSCVFDPSRDKRRRVGVKRSVDELNNYKKLLDLLLESLRSPDQQHVERIMGMIQNDASYVELAIAVGCKVAQFADDPLDDARKLGFLDDGDDLDLPNAAQLDSIARRLSGSTTKEEGSTSREELLDVEWTQRPGPSSYARVTLERICHIPLHQVPAKPWTRVTEDRELVSHLVTLYFTWDHPCAQLMDQRSFLDHMKSGDQSSEFCTPLLVNSLLAMASAYLDMPDASIPYDAFLSEADDLWNAEEGRPTLANVQSLLLVSCILKFRDKPNLSWLMLRQAVQLAQDMGLFQVPQVSNSSNALSPEMERVRTTTAWGVFNLNFQTAMELQKAPNLEKPATPVGSVGDNDVSWAAYPLLSDVTYAKQQAQLPTVREEFAILTNTLRDNQELFFGEDVDLSTEELSARAYGTLSRLWDWLRDWSAKTQLENHPVPQVLTMRMKCHQAIMNLCQTVIDRIQRGPNPNSQLLQWVHVKTSSAVETAQCLSIQQQSYGLDHIPSQMVDATQAGLKALVHHLEDSDEARQAFVELCQVGIALSPRFRTMANAIREIRSMASSQEIVLPPEAFVIPGDPEGSELGEGDEPIVDSIHEHCHDP